MGQAAEDPRRRIAARFGKLYEHGVKDTAVELLDTLLKRLPWKWLLAIVVAGGGSALKFVVIPYVASLTVQDWAERRGVHLEVGGWHADLWDLRVKATGIKLKGADRFTRDSLLEAGACELDFGATYHLFQYLYGRPLWDLVRLDLSAYGLSKLTIDHATLYIERRMSGHGNWDTTLARLRIARPPTGTPSPPAAVVPVAAVEPEAEPEVPGWPTFRPRNVELKGFKIEWIEHLPGGSGGGLIRNVQETLYIDDVEMVAHNRYAKPTGHLDEVAFNLEGRTADGRISLSGTWAPPTEPVLSFKTVLDNVGANAFARMVPDPALVPVSGSMNGSIELTLENDEWHCQGDLQLQNVAYQPVYDSYLARKNSDALSSGLRDFRANRRVALDCAGLKEDEGFGLVPYLQTTATRAAVQDAPKVVRAVAQVEVARTEAGVAGEDDLKTFVQKAVAGKIGNDLTAALATTAMSGAMTGGLPVPVPVPGVALPSPRGNPTPAPPRRGFGARFKSFFGR